MRLDRARRARLRLAEAAIQAVAPLAAAHPWLRSSRRTSRPQARCPPAPRPAALRLKVALGSAAGDTDLIPMSRVLRDSQADHRIFPGAHIPLQTPEPGQCAPRRQAHPGSGGIFPPRALSPPLATETERSRAATGVLAEPSASSAGYSSWKVKRLPQETHDERRGAGRGLEGS